MLSVISLIKIVKEFVSPDRFFLQLSTNSLSVGKTLQGWNGIDTPLCVKLIHLAYNYCERKEFEKIISFSDEKVKKIYEKVFSIYESACQKIPFLSFVPNIKGLEKIVKKSSIVL